MATQGEIASAFLRELGAPDTPLMQKAVIAWLHAESGNTITANNPWNMTLDAAKGTNVKTCGSWKSTSSGLVFAAFCSPQDGARASAQLLLSGGNDWRGYGHVVTAARAGNPITFLNSLAASAWDGGRYGTKNGGKNKLLGIYAALGGNVAASDYATAGPTSFTGGAEAAAAGSLSGIANLGAWGNLVKFPVGHTLTAADVDYIIATLSANGFFKDDPGNAAQGVTRAILTKHIGQTWDKPLQNTLQTEFLTAATNAVPKPLDALGAIASSFAQILAALFDPRKWLLVLALIAGAGLTAYGGKNILAAAR